MTDRKHRGFSAGQDRPGARTASTVPYHPRTSVASMPAARRTRLGLGALLAALLWSAPAFPQAAFDSLSGAWAGNGVVETSDGLHERVRCKAKYVTQSAGQGVQLDLRCASDAYRFELSSDISQSGDQLSGNWFESTHRVGGKLSGRNRDGLIEARAEGDTFTALLTVKTSGSRQSFLMESPGAKVSQVSIDLRRGP